MNKQDFLEVSVEHVLEQIGFQDLYRALCLKHKDSDDKFELNKSQLFEIAEKFGYKFKYSKAKGYYYEEVKGDFVFKLGFDIKWNLVEIGMSINNPVLNIKSAAPWDLWVELMLNKSENINRPGFKDLQDLESLLKETMDIYEKIKDGMIHISV